MGVRQDVPALLGKFEHAKAAKVVYFERVEEWVIEVDRSRDVDYDVALRCHHGSVLGTQAELVDDEVSRNWHNFCQELFLEAGILTEERGENFRRKNRLFKAFLDGDVLLGAHHDKEFLDVGQTADEFLENDFSDEASRASEENCLSLVKLFYS